ncbi:putative MFS multidrug transporter [Taphrina deformans PYCC 5710]|uniref:MFS multidrug transporter n=1 Tax=Taphrina deformans (strain PYCC 5710 / ATCC 11124 / CBS 356.35 / IMI 108563 / JCM 9778 / NBRC 8474) TaxID=1097556 RepID=R4XCR8_TAPDE|nr:putative MFS multidrug transporter [Taphrina deformans PYCC 5710]|eukprot:CCG83650.1 putative MFS multidrug transporter [Taphrina deformans PYCC 5710]
MTIGDSEASNTKENRDVEMGREEAAIEGIDRSEKTRAGPVHINTDVYLVEWDGPDDPENPQNWSFARKAWLTALLSMICLVCTFASSIFSTAQHAAGLHFGQPDEVMNLATTLFLFGYAVGPAIFAPLSEKLGRKVPLLGGYFLFAIFTVAGATSKDVQTLMLCRFFSGVTGSSPLVLVAAMFADFWSSEVRGIAVCLFSVMVFVGPSVAPVVGSFIVQSYLGWRWTLYITSIMAFTMLILGVVFITESYPSTILARRAGERRVSTGNFAWHHKSEEKPFRVGEIVTVYLTRPLHMLVKEPIVLLLSVYVAFVYAILYLMLEAVPIAFVRGRGWSNAIATLPFISIIIGCFAGAAVIIGFNPYYIRMMKANQGRPVPKARLPPMIIGGFVFPTGFFIFAWTADIKDGSVFWLAPCIGLALIGGGILLIFLQALNYLIDVYLMYAASAIAANTMLRSALAGIFPLVAGYMFVNMTVKWAATLLGLLALVMAPIPLLFYHFDVQLRRTSKFSMNKAA